MGQRGAVVAGGVWCYETAQREPVTGKVVRGTSARRAGAGCESEARAPVKWTFTLPPGESTSAMRPFSHIPTRSHASTSSFSDHSVMLTSGMTLPSTQALEGRAVVTGLNHGAGRAAGELQRDAQAAALPARLLASGACLEAAGAVVAGRCAGGLLGGSGELRWPAEIAMRGAPMHGAPPKCSRLPGIGCIACAPSSGSKSIQPPSSLYRRREPNSAFQFLQSRLKHRHRNYSVIHYSCVPLEVY